jgi:hypothetical protein
MTRLRLRFRRYPRSVAEAARRVRVDRWGAYALWGDTAYVLTWWDGAG